MAEREFINIPGMRQEVERRADEAEAEARHAEHEKRVDGLAHLRVHAPPATVVVEPGGKTFRTIKEANDSITDAGPSNVYMMNCGMGTWEEQVVLKPHVNLTGTLDPNTQEPITYIRCQALKAGTAGVGAIVGASNSSISQCLINSYALQGGTNAVAIACDGTDSFTISNCRIQVYNDGGFTLNGVAAISIDFIGFSRKGTSNVYIEYTNVNINMPNSSDYPVALGAGGTAKVTFNQGSLSASGRDHAAGAVAFETCNVRFNFAKVTGRTWSLLIWGNSAATMTAYKCTLTGPVDPRVKVIN